MAALSQLFRKGRALILSYDHGFELGPNVFNAQTVDPEHVLTLALEGGFSGIALHIGVAEKYYRGALRDVPLIVRVNGSTSMPHINPTAAQICSVERALKAGASAIGFTIYDGSPNEPKMFEAFARVCEQARDYGLPVIAWMYPRGPRMRGMSNEALAYASRVGLELGADAVKLRYNGDAENLRWIVRCAGRTKVIISLGELKSPMEFLNDAHMVFDSGASGISVGRNVWSCPKPYAVAKALKAIAYENKSAAEAAMYLTS